MMLGDNFVMKNTTLAVGMLLSTLGVAQAAPITVGGVTWDPDSLFDLSSTASIFEFDVNLPGDTLQFWGEIDKVNALGNFCQAGGCEELTLYGEYTVQKVGDFDSNGLADIVFDNGFVNVYSDPSADFDPLDLTTAQDGSLWLALTGHTYTFKGETGELFAELITGGDFSTPGDQGSGEGYFNVVGGAAKDYIVVATQTAPDGSKADFTFTQSFQPVEGTQGALLFGSADIQGQSERIPAPSTLALLGLAGLLIPAFRRKVVKV